MGNPTQQHAAISGALISQRERARYRFFQPDGHTGLSAVIFFVSLPFTHVIVFLSAPCVNERRIVGAE